MYTIWLKKIRFRRQDEHEHDGFAYIRYGCYRKWETWMPEEYSSGIIHIRWDKGGLDNYDDYPTKKYYMR